MQHQVAVVEALFQYSNLSKMERKTRNSKDVAVEITTKSQINFVLLKF